MTAPNRRDFLKGAGTLAAASALPLSLVELAFADAAQNFTFAYISDAHIQHIGGTKFVRVDVRIVVVSYKDFANMVVHK